MSLPLPSRHYLLTLSFTNINKLMKKILLGLLIGLGLTMSVVALAAFNSTQLAPAPAANQYLQTNGSINTWISISDCNTGQFLQITANVFGCGTPAGGGGGSGGGWSTSTPATIYNSFGNSVGINSTTPNSNLVVEGVAASSTLPILSVASSTNSVLFQVTAAGNVNIATLTASSLLLTDANKNLSSYGGASNCGNATAVIGISAAGGTTCSLNGLQAALTNPDTGTGVSGQVTFWSGTTALSGATQFLWDNTAKSLMINTTTPTGATLDLIASTSAQTLPILQVSSTTGASLFNVSTLGNVNIATLTTSSLVLTDANDNLKSYVAPSNCGNATALIGITAAGAYNCSLNGLQAAITNPVTGTGVAGQAAYWSSTSAISGSSAFLWDNTAKSLMINTSTPTGGTLDLVASSSAQTVPILTVSSTTGASFFKIFVDGGMAYATSTDATTTAIFAGQYYSAEFDAGTSTATTTIDWAKANVQRIGVNTSTLAILFANQKPGGRYLLLVQAATTTTYTITWPSAVKWAGAAAPTLTSGTYGQIDIASFLCGFTLNCYGMANTNFSP
jgi:hypothetical protein